MTSTREPDPRESAISPPSPGRLPLFLALAALAALIVCFVFVVRPADEAPAKGPRPAESSQPAEAATGRSAAAVPGDKDTGGAASIDPSAHPSTQPSRVRPLP